MFLESVRWNRAARLVRCWLSFEHPTNIMFMIVTVKIIYIDLLNTAYPPAFLGHLLRIYSTTRIKMSSSPLKSIKPVVSTSETCSSLKVPIIPAEANENSNSPAV